MAGVEVPNPCLRELGGNEWNEWSGPPTQLPPVRGYSIKHPGRKQTRAVCMKQVSFGRSHGFGDRNQVVPPESTRASTPHGLEVQPEGSFAGHQADPWEGRQRSNQTASLKNGPAHADTNSGNLAVFEWCCRLFPVCATQQTLLVLLSPSPFSANQVGPLTGQVRAGPGLKPQPRGNA